MRHKSKCDTRPSTILKVKMNIMEYQKGRYNSEKMK